ncbi:phosphotransferase family protein, partial [Butyricicoccus intestinisimiae]|uniref:phosphotransferase family protein n=1 Tax=Butyricicoccus intestinisimiae TaxID=2841509 RepID=UPI003D933450
AKKFDIDPTYIYMDVDEGWKVSKYVHHFREPDYGNFEDSKKILSVLRKLHHIPGKVDYGMRPWEDALQMEAMLRDKDKGCFKPFEKLKNKIFWLYERTKQDDVKPCFCHGDTYKHNWMIRNDGTVILIDWEYAGYSDPGIDIGYYIVDAMYDFKEADFFIREYLGESATPGRIFHFMAYTAIIAYYWFVWAMYRKSCGADVDDSMKAWYFMAVKYAEHLCDNA